MTTQLESSRFCRSGQVRVISPRNSCTNDIYGSSEDRDVVIKVVRREEEGLDEYNILRLLNSDPLRFDVRNRSVTVLEFLEYDKWHFAVMPFCDGCDEIPFRSADEGLDFAEQVLTVGFLFDV